MIRGIIDLIVSDSTAAGLIGSFDGRVKVFPVVAEQDCPKPYTLLRRTAEVPTQVKAQGSEWDTTTVNVTAYAEKYKTCIDILNRIRTVIDNFKGTSETIVYNRIVYVNSQDLFDKDDNAFVIVDTYSVTFKRVP